MQSLHTLFRSAPLLCAALLLVAVVFLHDCASTVNGDDDTKHYLQPEEDHLRTYIIHVEHPPAGHAGTHRDWHESFLDHTGAATRLVHSYNHVLSGFAARLTDAEVHALRGTPGFLNAQPTRRLELHTTHTPIFLGLQQGVAGAWASKFNYGRGVIIGVLDTGISPSHPSFLDDGNIPAPPAKWKGKCEFHDASLCNNKLIGARSFLNSSSKSKPSFQPFDDDGHGTHTAGTAAGAFVAGASILNNAKGTAIGMAPWAHVAAYQVCNETCYDADVVAGIEAAVADGVDIISMSLGGAEFEFYNDSIGIATFAAARKGVLVSVSAGNSGPDYFSAGNTYPWALTVGASTTDRRIRAVVRLANRTEFQGESAYQPANFNSNSFLPLVLPFFNKNDSSFELISSLTCSNKTALELADVKGKIVVCMIGGELVPVDKGKLVKEAGGAAMIIMNFESRGYDTRAQPHELPAAHVTYADGVAIRDYIKAAQDPTATIVFEGTKIGSSFGDPSVVAFSSRGPSLVNMGVLKPDIVGPGINILAAWPEPVGPFPLQPPFNMISGTSMSCPHLSGIAALLKSKYPDWSAAMIKSALMTTADEANINGNLIRDDYNNMTADVLTTGAGHVNPLRAAYPGLVYDTRPDEYVAYLCGLGYTDAQVRLIAHDAKPTKCSDYPKITGADLNYPSITVNVTLSPSTTGHDVEVTINRTVTNVGSPNSSYTVKTSRPQGLVMAVQPETLEFSPGVTMASFTVRFGLNKTESDVIRASINSTTLFLSQGSLTWVPADSGTSVRSAIAVLFGGTLPFTASLQAQSLKLH